MNDPLHTVFPQQNSPKKGRYFFRVLNVLNELQKLHIAPIRQIIQQ